MISQLNLKNKDRISNQKSNLNKLKILRKRLNKESLGKLNLLRKRPNKSKLLKKRLKK